jgi:D-3-phosphoglycerate dehydrogenase
MRWKVLNTIDATACPGVFTPLSEIADVEHVPARQDLLRDQIAKFGAYLASLHVRMDHSVLERACRLRVIATASTGLDHIDLKCAAERGVAILSLKADTEFLNSITATAEITWALLLATVRQLPWAFAAALEGRWARDEFRGRQLSGKTLGILGYGRLGRIVGQYGKAFRMHVLAHDIKAAIAEDGIEMVTFERLLTESDVLSIHIHLNDFNRGLMDAAAIGQMKPGAVLINTSRGGIVDEAALLNALQSGKLSGAGLDVIDGEWRQDLDQHPLIRYAGGHRNLVISPHIGVVAVEAQRAAIERTLVTLRNYLQELARRDAEPPRKEVDHH